MNFFKFIILSIFTIFEAILCILYECITSIESFILNLSLKLPLIIRKKKYEYFNKHLNYDAQDSAQDDTYDDTEDDARDDTEDDAQDDARDDTRDDARDDTQDDARDAQDDVRDDTEDDTQNDTEDDTEDDTQNICIKLFNYILSKDITLVYHDSSDKEATCYVELHFRNSNYVLSVVFLTFGISTNLCKKSNNSNNLLIRVRENNEKTKIMDTNEELIIEIHRILTTYCKHIVD